MKKCLLTAGALLMWSGTVFAGGGEMVTVPAEDYKAILQKLDALQNRVNVLESDKKAPGASVTQKDYDRLATDIDNIYDTLDVVETKTLKDRINFGAELRTRVDNYKLKNGDMQLDLGTGNPMFPSETEHDDNNWTNRFRLNMDAKINSTLSFHGRMTVYKNWGDSDITTSTLYNELNRAHRPGDSGVKLDRAYIDWVPDFIIPVAITVGRHPSTEGPPIEFKENRKRQSTYPGLIFDTENDGIVVTFGLERYIGLKNAGLRFAYGKGYHSDYDESSSFSFFDDTSHDTSMYASFFESEIPGVANSLVVLSYAHMLDLPTSFLGTDPSSPTGNPLSVGDMDLYGIHLQAADVIGSNFDVFASWGYNDTDANGNTNLFGMGLLSDGTKDKTGSAIYAGLRYNIAYAPLNDPKIGFEYNHGSKNWMSMTMGSAEMFDKLATRGDAYEVYYIQPVNKNLFFRTGYTHIDYDYTGSGSHLGSPQDSEAELDNYYFLMDVRF